MQIQSAYRRLPPNPPESLLGKFPSQRERKESLGFITPGKTYDIQMVEKEPGCPLWARGIAVVSERCNI